MSAHDATPEIGLVGGVNRSARCGGDVPSDFGRNEQPARTVREHRQQDDDRIARQPLEILRQILIPKTDPIFRIVFLLVGRELAARDLSRLPVELGRAGNHHDTLRVGLQPLRKRQRPREIEFTDNAGDIARRIEGSKSGARRAAKNDGSVEAQNGLMLNDELQRSRPQRHDHIGLPILVLVDQIACGACLVRIPREASEIEKIRIKLKRLARPLVHPFPGGFAGDDAHGEQVVVGIQHENASRIVLRTRRIASRPEARRPSYSQQREIDGLLSDSPGSRPIWCRFRDRKSWLSSEYKLEREAHAYPCTVQAIAN